MWTEIEQDGIGNKFEHSLEWAIEDNDEDSPTLERTSREILKVVNSFEPDLRCTLELETDFPNGKIPTLDTSMSIHYSNTTPTTTTTPRTVATNTETATKPVHPSSNSPALSPQLSPGGHDAALREGKVPIPALPTLQAPPPQTYLPEGHGAVLHEGEVPTPNPKVCRILHQFYSKPMASNKCDLVPSARAWSAKSSTLAQEVIRRLMNTSRHLPSSERVDVLDNFTSQMKHSGYSRLQSRFVIL